MLLLLILVPLKITQVKTFNYIKPSFFNMMQQNLL